MITQGDQYYLPFTIFDGETTYTPDNVRDARIQIGDNQYVFSQGTLFWKDNAWYVPLTQSQTMSFPRTVEMQTQIKLATTPETIITSEIKKEPIHKCICKGAW